MTFSYVKHFSFTLINRLTNTKTAHSQTLESVGADPHLSVCVGPAKPGRTEEEQEEEARGR